MPRNSDVEQKCRWNPERGEARRPFRLWDSQHKKNVRWRCYATARNALNAALLETRWLPVGATLEVYDARTWQVFGTYKRHVNTISFTEVK